MDPNLVNPFALTLLSLGLVLAVAPLAQADGEVEAVCGVNLGSCSGGSVCGVNFGSCSGGVCAYNGDGACSGGVCGANTNGDCTGGICGVNTYSGDCSGGICGVNTGQCLSGICGVNLGTCGCDFFEARADADANQLISCTLASLGGAPA
jgi:hypothetical protein